MNKIPLFKPPRLKGKYLKEVLQSGHLTAGPWVERLEAAIAKEAGVEPTGVVCTSSACAAWEALLRVLRPATVSVREDTFPLIKDLARSVGRRAQVVGLWEPAEVGVITHIGGCEGGSWRQVKPECDWLVEDACHIGIGGSTSVEWTEDFWFTSFYPTKLLSGAEGGVLVANTERALVEMPRVRQIVNCGFLGWPRDYYTRVSGAKLHMTDLQASLNMEALEGFAKRQLEVEAEWKAMDRETGRALSEVAAQYVDMEHTPYLAQVSIGRPWTRELWKKAKELPIETAWNFPPNRRLTVPMWPGMTEAEREVVANSVKELLSGISS